MKPALFKNDLLAVADPIHTVIFAGLWCYADRAGLLEDRPAKIHFEINPGRQFQTTVDSLKWLTEQGFIRRYRAADADYIAVVEFAKHQNPHHKEPASKLPAPGVSPSEAPDKPQADPSLAVLIPDSGFLIPDSGYLIPDSLNPRPSVRGSEANEIAKHVEAIKSEYPKGSRQNWITAEHHMRQLVATKCNVRWLDLISSVCRYREFIRETGQAVMNPATFFSAADEPWNQAWDKPEGKKTKFARVMENLNRET